MTRVFSLLLNREYSYNGETSFISTQNKVTKITKTSEVSQAHPPDQTRFSGRQFGRNAYVWFDLLLKPETDKNWGSNRIHGVQSIIRHVPEWRTQNTKDWHYLRNRVLYYSFSKMYVCNAVLCYIEIFMLLFTCQGFSNGRVPFNALPKIT